MIVKPSDTVAVQFTTQNPITGAAANADSLPTGVLVRNGEDTAESVTVTNESTGVYKASVVVPSGYSAGDEIQICISATVALVAGKAIIWTGIVDTTRISEVAAAVWAVGTRTLTSISALASQIASAVLDAVATDYDTAGTVGAKISNSAGGSGSSTYTATITDANGNTLDGVQVWATTDVGGANIVASGVTNSHGQITFALDPANYYLWRQRAGQNFTNPVGFTVT